MTRHGLRDARLAIHGALVFAAAWLALVARPGDGAAACWMAASFGVVGLCATGPDPAPRLARLLSALVLAALNGAAALRLMVQDPAGSGSGAYAALAGLGFYLAWRRSDEGD